MKVRYIFYFAATILLGIGSVWLLINGNRLLTRSTSHAPTAASTATWLPSSTPRQPTVIPIPSPTEWILIGPFVSQQAPEFALNSLEGKQVKLGDYRGKVILINFWASWCLPCKEEMPLIQTASEQYRDQGLVVLGINMTDLDDRKAIDGFVQETGVSFPILLDKSGSVSNDYRVFSIPTSFFIDRMGIIQHFQMGAMSAKQLQEYLDEMLK